MTTFMPPPPASTFLAFHPQDNNIIAIGMEDSTIHIYNVRVDEVLFLCISYSWLLLSNFYWIELYYSFLAGEIKVEGSPEANNWFSLLHQSQYFGFIGSWCPSQIYNSWALCFCWLLRKNGNALKRGVFFSLLDLRMEYRYLGAEKISPNPNTGWKGT